jgi:hypothetical protein
MLILKQDFKNHDKQWTGLLIASVISAAETVLLITAKSGFQ